MASRQPKYAKTSPKSVPNVNRTYHLHMVLKGVYTAYTTGPSLGVFAWVVGAQYPDFGKDLLLAVSISGLLPKTYFSPTPHLYPDKKTPIVSRPPAYIRTFKDLSVGFQGS
jgi:hypothetical protein